MSTLDFLTFYTSTSHLRCRRFSFVFVCVLLRSGQFTTYFLFRFLRTYCTKLALRAQTRAAVKAHQIFFFKIPQFGGSRPTLFTGHDPTHRSCQKILKT